MTTRTPATFLWRHRTTSTGTADTIGSGTARAPPRCQQQPHHSLRRRTITSLAQRVHNTQPTITMGCVCYDPTVGDIWGGIQNYLQSQGVLFDYVLYASYESQIRALLQSHIDVAWNGPIAHVVCEELAPGRVVSLGMRDVDRNFQSVVIVRKDANIQSVADLQGKRILTGSSDSPQAHVVPLYALQTHPELLSPTFAPASVTVLDRDVGKHGDTAVGEICALQALCSNKDGADASGRYDVALVSRMMWDRAVQGFIPGLDAATIQDTCHILESVSIPPFDHCQFDALLESSSTSSDQKREALEAFGLALFHMSMDNPEQGRLMKLEGIAESWMGPRQSGYDVVRKAMGVSSSHRPASNFPYTATTTTGSRRSFSTLSNRLSSRKLDPAQARVAVIGAGVAGLQAIRALQGKGYNVTALEASSNVGGLWQKNYANFGVQVPKQLYEFQDFPMDSVTWGDYASGPQVQRYIETYATAFGLRRAIQFNTRVVRATQVPHGWKLEFDVQGQRSVKDFDYLVVATGLYSGLNGTIPTIPGLNDKFQGKVLHSTDFDNAQLAQNQRVVVIGGGKSAVDCAIEAARAGASTVTLLQRAAHWPTPRKIAGLIPFQYIFLSRFGTALVSAHQGTYPGGSGAVVNAFRNTVGPYIVKPVFRIVEELFAVQLGLKGELRPKRDIVADFYDVALVLNSDFQDLRKSGQVNVKVGEIAEVKASGRTVHLKDGSSLDADVIVSATGFGQDYNLFDEATRRNLDIQSDGVYLHRYILPAKVPNLAFIGHVGAISNISSYGLQAEWLARNLTGELASGSDPDQVDIEARKAWARSFMPDSVKRGMLVLLHQTHYHDQLLRDMGENPLRKSNLLAEYLMPYEPADYSGIVGGIPK